MYLASKPWSKYTCLPGRISVSIGLLALSSCYPGDITDIQELDVAATSHDENFNFGSVQTYSMPDSIVRLTLGGSNGGGASSEFDDLILDEIAQQFANLGYVRELNPEQNPPDVVVLVATTTSEQWVSYTPYPYYDYWGWYPGWDPYLGVGPGGTMYYPWAAPVTVVYRTGTLLIDMVDPVAAEPADMMLPSVWLGAVNGLLEGSSVNITRRVLDGIEQVFEQSPYLTDN